MSTISLKRRSVPQRTSRSLPRSDLAGCAEKGAPAEPVSSPASCASSSLDTICGSGSTSSFPQELSSCTPCLLPLLPASVRWPVLGSLVSARPLGTDRRHSHHHPTRPRSHRRASQILGNSGGGGNFIGRVGALLLAFTAGLETRQKPHLPAATDLPPARRGDTVRLVASAVLALVVSAVGTTAARFFFLRFPDWTAPSAAQWWGPWPSACASPSARCRY